MGKFKPKSDMFSLTLLDIVEIGRANNVEVVKISIKGVYEGEIFKVSYSPKEEGYAPEDTQ